MLCYRSKIILTDLSMNVGNWLGSSVDFPSILSAKEHCKIKRSLYSNYHELDPTEKLWIIYI